MVLALPLSLLIGLSLGLLGGGGSILTVPILIYALGVEAKAAIATSLLVVGITSAVAVLQHARAKNVEWRTGFLFGSVGMLGAYGGGLLAGYLSAAVLLVLFAALMVGTALAMLRGRKAESEKARASGAMPIGEVILHGLVVGALTGLVGAGGGFLVVPALVLFGRLPMHRAVGTSLLVIALKSFAAFAGHAGHVAIDYSLAAVVVGAAVTGSLIGSQLARYVSQEKLRRGFAWFVLAMAAFLLYQQAPPALRQILFVERWPFWVGGLAIGGFVLLFLLTQNRLLGVSTGYTDACAAPFDPEARRSWRLPFLLGIVGGGLLAGLLGGGPHFSFAAGIFDAVVSSALWVKALLFTVGGVLLGFGARLAGGCTSGHSIVGVAQLAPSSLIATAGFMATGFLVTNLLLRALGA